MSVSQLRGEIIVVGTDEGSRSGTSVELLTRLTPAIETGGIIPESHTSQISDGVAATVLMSDVRVAELPLHCRDHEL